MFRTMIIAAALAASCVGVPAAHAGGFPALEYADGNAATKPDANRQDGQDRLMIVSRNSGRVIYDDGRNDLFCVTQRYVAGYTEEGHRIFRRTMRCR